MMCRVLRVSRSGYYAWAERKPGKRAVEDARLLLLIKGIHELSGGTYGSPRVHAVLRDQHHECISSKRVARLMRAAGLVGVHRRKHRKKAQRDPQRPVFKDLVKRGFTAAAPDELWFADITQHPTLEGLLYLAVVLDAFSRRVITGQ